MRAIYSQRFLLRYTLTSMIVKRAVDKQVKILLLDLRHPSLRAKKYNEAQDIWQARVNGDWRFYFTIEGEAYHLTDLTPHPK